MCFHFMGHRVSRPLASMWLVDLFLSVPKALTVQGRGGRSGNHAVVGATVGDEQPGRRIVSQGTEKKYYRSAMCTKSAVRRSGDMDAVCLPFPHNSPQFRTPVPKSTMNLAWVGRTYEFVSENHDGLENLGGEVEGKVVAG